MPRKCRAVVDIGTVRLLVVQWDGEQAHCIFWDKITTRLIAGMENGLLQPDAIARTAKALEQLTRHARALGADVLAFGTSAMRDARNSGLLIEECRPFLPHIRILSGDEEATWPTPALPGGQAGRHRHRRRFHRAHGGKTGVPVRPLVSAGAVRLAKPCRAAAIRRTPSGCLAAAAGPGDRPYLPLSWWGAPSPPWLP